MRALLALLTSTGWLSGCTCGEPPAEPPAPAETLDRTVDAPPTVVVVVVDTLRADHVSACGAPWPITPTLDALAAREDAVLACDGWSSGTWTHPSHASLFTGRPAHEHGALWAPGSGASLNAVTTVHPLGDDEVTLAESFAKAGYQTALVSANPILVPESGLQQGFGQVRIARGVHEYRGDGIGRPLLGVLSATDRRRPLLLVVNLYDAHDPYPAVPPGQPWGEPQPPVFLKPNVDEDTPYRQFHRGTHPEPEAYRATLRAGYAQGVHEADRTLGLVMTALERFRDLDAGMRLIVTSDHGEHLGEHGVLRHGGFLWEPGLRIPAVWIEQGATPAPLPEPFALHVLHDVVAFGEIHPREVVVASDTNPSDVRGGELGAARRLGPGGRHKHVCRGDVITAHDLVADPSERSSTTVDDPELAAICRTVVRQWRREGQPVSEALRAVGYAD